MKEKIETKRTLLHYVLLAVKGACMGAADVVPGVSGGTIAFVTGIYEELVGSVKSIRLSLFRLLVRGKFSAFWKQLNGGFLLALLCGILASIFSLAKLITSLLHTHPIPVWSFFMGLVAASAIYILKSLKKGNVWSVVSLLIGVFLAIIVCRCSPAQTPDGYWFLFLTGAIAICAMILPGISGSFIMVLFGKYTFIMNAVSTLQWNVLLVFGLGAVVGLLSFSRMLWWLLKNYYIQTVCLLAGFMFGSIEKIWPWKTLVAEGVFHNTTPAKYGTISGLSPQTGVAILFMALGFVVVFGVDFLSKRMKQAK